MSGGKGGGGGGDPVAGAKEAGEQGRKLNESQTHANRPDQYNEYGSNQWTNKPQWDPTSGQYVNKWTQTQTMDPHSKKMLDNQRSQDAWMDLGANVKGAQAIGEYGKEFNIDKQFGKSQSNEFDGGGPVEKSNWNAMGGQGDFQGGGDIPEFNYDVGEGRQASEDAAYARSTSRLDPQYERKQADLETKLRGQGLSSGDQAYDSAMANLDRARTDAYSDARYGATSEGRQEAQQNYGQRLGQADYGMRRQGQGYGQDAQSYGMNQGNRQQQYEQYMGGKEFNKDSQGQQFNQNQQQAQWADYLRGQGIDEAKMQRDMPYEEFLKLKGGRRIEGQAPSGG